jgi:serine/threonine protein kinase
MENYKIGEKLGSGSSGQVYRAIDLTTGRTVAIKKIQNLSQLQFKDAMVISRLSSTRLTCSKA